MTSPSLTSRKHRYEAEWLFLGAAMLVFGITLRDEWLAMVALIGSLSLFFYQRRQRMFDHLVDLQEQKRVEAEQALQGSILELVAAKQAADESNKTKSRFLAAASHDLRQPIQAINLFHAALERTGLTEEQQRLSHYLSLSINSLSELLNALLDISRLESGVVNSCPVVILADDLFNRIDAEFSPLTAEKALRFKLFFPLREMAILTDSELLMSLLRNLIDNAIKYTRQGGVLVSIRRRGKEALLQVWDTGIGISSEHTDSIFDAYFQVENPERDRAKGLGLGLSIVQIIAKLLNTEVIYRSRLGRGTVFEFRLPLANTAAKEMQHQAMPDAMADDSAFEVDGYRVVVIDDDALVAKATAVSLASLGMAVTTFTNAEEALASPEIMNADFYISDFRLPGLNGSQLLDAIQKRSPELIKAVLLTGDGSSSRIELTQSSGWPVLFKPIDLEKLVAAMRQQNPRA